MCGSFLLQAIEHLIERLAHDAASGADDKATLCELSNGITDHTEETNAISSGGTDDQENTPPDTREVPSKTQVEPLANAITMGESSCANVTAEGWQNLADIDGSVAHRTANGNHSRPEENGVIERIVEGMLESKAAASSMAGENQEESMKGGKPVGKGKQPSRNRPCVCGSGRRYKNCCGAAKAAAARRQKAAEANADVTAANADVMVEQLSTLYI